MENSRYRNIKAYANKEFMDSPDARPLRILSEYQEPATRLDHFKIKDTIVFMGSARIPSREDALKALDEAKVKGEDLKRAQKNLDMSRYYEDTRELARRLTEWSKGLESTGSRFVVCTGGGPGIMEAANRGASEAKGVNIGFNISLPFEQNGNPYITRQLSTEFHYFFMRKFWFAYLAKAIIYMPGGFGTLDELFEVATLIQTRKIEKHLPLVLFGNDFWSRILDMDALVDMGTISPEDPDLFFRTDSVDEAFEFITSELSTHALNKPGASLK